MEAAAAAAGAVGAANAGAGGAVAVGVAGSPSRAVISASLSAGEPLRARPACSAAIADLLHFFPAATHFATSSLMPALGALVAVAEVGDAGAAAACAGVGAGAESADAGAVAAGAESASTFSQSMGRPAFNASISASVSSGKPSRLRLACSIAKNELLSALRGQGGRCPITPFTAPFGESSAISACPPGIAPQNHAQTSKLNGRPTCNRECILHHLVCHEKYDDETAVVGWKRAFHQLLNRLLKKSEANTSS